MAKKLAHHHTRYYHYDHQLQRWEYDPPKAPTNYIVALILAVVFVVIVGAYALVTFWTYGTVLPKWQDRFITSYELEHGVVSDATAARLVSAVAYVCRNAATGYDLIEIEDDLVQISGYSQGQVYSIEAGAATFACPYKIKTMMRPG